MSAYHVKPAAEISEYVDRILVIDNYTICGAFSLPLFANGTPTLLFLSSPGSIDGRPTNNLTLFGQTVFPENLVIRESFTLVAYFFKPFALQNLFGISGKELTDQPIDLNLLTKIDADILKDQLLNAPHIAAMIGILDSFVHRLIVRTTSESSIVKYATTLIARNPSPDMLVRLQKELFVTPRTFQRQFKETVGICADMFRRICQFHAAFQQVNSRRFDKISDVAFDNGFFDQSHFIRTFKEFTNLTPGQYLDFAS